MSTTRKITDPNKIQIDTITRQFFSIFNNADQKQPDWTVLDKICISETIIIKKTGLTQQVYDLADFVAPRRAILTNGTLTNFQETELNEETKIIGNIAQRSSTYQKTGCANGSGFIESGTKLFQFINTTEGWKISALVWEND